MREMILQLLPKYGVLSVPGVPLADMPQKITGYDIVEDGTPSEFHGVLSVLYICAEHLPKNKVFHEITNETAVCTPRTPGTPYFDYLVEVVEVHRSSVNFSRKGEGGTNFRGFNFYH